jgi:hypothetical protein
VQITFDETLTWNHVYQAIAVALNVRLKVAHALSDFLAQCGDYDFESSLTGDKANSVVLTAPSPSGWVPGFTAAVRFDQRVKETHYPCPCPPGMSAGLS